LSEHVDYWNELGWTDPFSSALFTDRQQGYARAIRRGEVYTPQMVVDGATALVGSDERKAIETITAAAKAPKAAIAVSCGSNPQTIRIRIDTMTSVEADVALAVAENGLQSRVGAGENRGRLLPHSSVTRRLTTIGRMKKQQSFTAEPAVALDKSWKRENISLVVFLQERPSLRIFGAAQIAITSCAAN
jgi:hypothetical protein